MKKAIVMICLVCMMGNIFGAVIETVSGDKIEGKVVGMRQGSYYVETTQGMRTVSVSEVVSLTNNKKDETQRYAKMRDWGIKPTMEDMIKMADPHRRLAYEQMTPFEREYLNQMQQMNSNTRRISDTMITLTIIGLSLSVVSTLIVVSNTK